MEELMSKAALSAVSPIAEPEEKLVTLTINDATGEVIADLDPLEIPFNFRGYIRWRIEHPTAAFAETPIVFTEGPRTVPPPATPKTCRVWWENANTGSAPVSYAYKAQLLDGLHFMKHDPTVENDPPGFTRNA
jgi:hypothetical protein